MPSDRAPVGAGGPLLVKGGMVYDGLGAPGRTLDVLVDNGIVADLAPSIDCADAQIVDAEGLVVAPGFIDIHSHSDFTLLVDPRAVSSITQGVTTEVIGNCGYGCAPIGTPVLAKESIYGYRDEPALSWHDLAGYFQHLEAANPAVNVAALVPNGQLRLSTVGLEQRPARPDELAQMQRLLCEGLEQGAYGYSTGLEYATEIGAPEEEITCLCGVVARYDGLYATHTRNRDEAAAEAIEEALRTAEAAGVRLQVSHILPRGGRENAERGLDLVLQARERGSPVAFDMHTRFFGTTYLKVLIPVWAFEGGRQALARRLRSSRERARMAESRNLITAIGDWSKVVLLDNPALPDFSRKDFATIGRMMGKPPLDAAYDLLLTEIDQLHRPMVILHTYSEDLLRLAYAHRECSIGSDATALAPDGPLAGASFHGAYSWASWFWRRIVRETSMLTPEEGIRRLTSLPADRLGLKGRGVLRRGAPADIIVFDGNTFAETATTYEPNRLAEGMIHVFVNGIPSLMHGRLLPARAGRVLRKE